MTGLSSQLTLMQVCILIISLILSCPAVSYLGKSGLDQKTNDQSASASEGHIMPQGIEGVLNGPWNVVPGAAIPPSKISHHESRSHSVDLPGAWPFKEISNEPEAFTFWADVKLSRSRLSGDNFALWPGRFISEFKIFIEDESGGFYKAFDNTSNDESVVSLSGFSASEFTSKNSSTVKSYDALALQGGRLPGAELWPIKRVKENVRIVIHVFLDDRRLNPVMAMPQLGLYSDMYGHNLNRTLIHGLFGGAFLLIVFGSCCLMCFSGLHRPLHSMITALSFLAFLRLLATGDLVQQIIPNLTVNAYIYLTWGLTFSLLSIFVALQYYLMPLVHRQNLLLKRVLAVLTLLPLTLVIAAFFVDLSVFIQFSQWYRIAFVIVALVYSIWLSFSFFRKESSAIDNVPVLLVIAGGCFDSYIYLSGNRPYIELFAVTLFFSTLLHIARLGFEYFNLQRYGEVLRSQYEQLHSTLERQVKVRTESLESVNKSLSLAALTDSLTKIPNRRAFDLKINHEILRAKRIVGPLSLAIFDVDWFKSVNDTYGHDFGDEVLVEIGLALRERLRITDFIARIGGEEFAVVLPDTSSSEAMLALEECRQAVSKLQFSRAPNLGVSVSVGVASWQSWLTAADLYRHADEALYQAKAGGRDKVCYAAIFAGTGDLSN